MEFLFLALTIGFLVGYKNLVPNFFSKALFKIINISLIVTLIALGFKIGATPEVIKSLNQLGIQALIMGIFATSGSIISVYCIEKKVNLACHFEGELEDNFEENQDNYSIMPVVIFLTAGIILGLYLLPKELIKYADLTVILALYVMVFGIGTDLGSNKEILHEIRKYGLRAILLPLGVIIGAVIGGIFAGMILNIPLSTAAGIAAGCGFYSFTGPYISEMISVKLGTVGFLANLFREVGTFFILPFLVQKVGKVSSIASGGATTMDTTLPIVIKVAGSKFAFLAILSGMTLTAIVPILVPIIVGL